MISFTTTRAVGLSSRLSVRTGVSNSLSLGRLTVRLLSWSGCTLVLASVVVHTDETLVHLMRILPRSSVRSLLRIVLEILILGFVVHSWISAVAVAARNLLVSVSDSSWPDGFARNVDRCVGSQHVCLFVPPHDEVPESQESLFLERTSSDLCDIGLLLPDWNLFHELRDEPSLVFEVEIVVSGSRRPDTIENFVNRC